MTDLTDLQEESDSNVVGMDNEEVVKRRPIIRDILLTVSLILIGLWAVKRYHTGPPPAAPDVLQEQAERPSVPVVEASDELWSRQDHLTIAGAKLGSLIQSSGRPLEQAEGWARLETPYGDIVVIRNTRYGNGQEVFLQGTALVCDGKIVLSAGARAPKWSLPEIRMQVKDGKVFGFTTGSLTEALEVFPNHGSHDSPRHLWAPHSSIPRGYSKLANIGQWGYGADIMPNFSSEHIQFKDFVLVTGEPVLVAIASSSSHGTESMVKYLLETGADVQAQDLNGKTALDVAATKQIRAALQTHSKASK